MSDMHKKEVEKLNKIQEEIEQMIQDKGDSLFMKTWLEYLEQKNICNLVFINHLKSLLNENEKS